MSIKSGTLRRKYEEAISKKIVCKAALLMTLVQMEKSKNYTVDDKIKLAKLLINDGKYSTDQIGKILPQIADEYLPTQLQASSLLSLINQGDYTYEDGYISFKLLRSVKLEALLNGSSEESKPDHHFERVDTAALKNYIYEEERIEDILDAIGCGHIQYHSSSGYFTCSNCDGDNPTAVLVNDNPYIGVTNWTREKFFAQKADIIDLVKYNLKCDFKSAIDFLQTFLGIKSGDLSKYDIRTEWDDDDDNQSQTEVKQSSLDESILNRYISLPPYQWMVEGMTPSTIEKFEIKTKYSEKSKELEEAIIPIRHYETGKLLAINRRNMREESISRVFGIPKYSITSGYLKHENLYGLYQNRDSILKAGYVVVYEAEKSVSKRDSVGDSTGVALQGHTLSEKQAQILLDLDVDIIISMDNDVQLGDIRYICGSYFYRRNQRRVYYTYDTHGYLGEKDSIADHCGEIFNTIFAEKVLYDKTEHEKLLTQYPRLRNHEVFLEPLRIPEQV